MENHTSRPDVYNRMEVAKIISKWYPDLTHLISINEQLHTTTDMETLYAHLEPLHNVAKYIWERSQREIAEKDQQSIDDRKDEVVFVYDDDTSSGPVNG